MWVPCSGSELWSVNFMFQAVPLFVSNQEAVLLPSVTREWFQDPGLEVYVGEYLTLISESERDSGPSSL